MSEIQKSDLESEENLKNINLGDNFELITEEYRIYGEIIQIENNFLIIKSEASEKLIKIDKHSINIESDLEFEILPERDIKFSKLKSFKILKQEKPEFNTVLKQEGNFSEKVSETSKLNFQSLLEMSSLHLSENLPENPNKDLSVSEFSKKSRLKSYQFPFPKHETLKYDFLDEKNANLGWKIHLNVSAENSKKVSDYLIKNGYFHKFLGGGEADDGKIFTIYFGTPQITEKFSKIISEDLEDLLSKPEAKDEAEFAKGIVGRFGTYDKDGYNSLGFAPGGSYGMSYSKGKIKHNGEDKMLVLVAQHLTNGRDKSLSGKDKVEKLEALGKINFDLLEEKYAEYFTG